ncbi:unnamed protein product [Closterium sp. NIES-53]
MRTHWHDAIGRHCPRFGINREVALPIPRPVGFEMAEHSYKMSLSVGNEKFVTPWLLVIGRKSQNVPLIEVTLTHFAGDLRGVQAKVHNLPHEYLERHRQLALEFRNESHWPKHVLMRYTWNEYAEVDVTAGLLVLFASTFILTTFLAVYILQSSKDKLAKFMNEQMAESAAAVPGGGEVAKWLSGRQSVLLRRLLFRSNGSESPVSRERTAGDSGAMQCNACNAGFDDGPTRNAHYRSDWHRYNLKRKVAGLPGVTEQWFEKRKEAVAAAAAAVSGGKRGAVAAATAAAAAAAAATAAAGDIAAGGDVGGGAAGGAHASHLRSKLHASKAAAAVAASRAGATGAGIIGAGVQGSGVLDPSRPLIRRVEAKPVVVAHRGTGVGVKDKGKGVVGEDEKEEEEEEEEWEEVDEDEAAALLAEGGEEVDEGEEGEEGGEEGEGSKGEEGKEGEEGEAKGKGEGEGVGEWDVSRCFFCDKKNKGGVDECVEHMHRHHGFFIPDMEFLTDLQGMLQYLAAKVTQGRMCLWCDDRSKQFSSVEAVRAHMEAKSHAKLRYGDGSGVAEEELEDFYDFSTSYEEGTSRELIVADDTRPHVALTSGGMELIIFNAAAGKAGSRGADKGACGTKRVIGSRDLARYYRQKPKPTGDSNTRLVASVLARYRAMGLATRQLGWRTAEQQQQMKQKDATAKGRERFERFRTSVGMNNNINWNLPKNVPY